MIIDHTDDLGQYAKVAHILGDGFSREALTASSPFDEDYALVMDTPEAGLQRRYPIMTKEAAALSIAYFRQYHQNIHSEYLVKTAEALKAAAGGYGLEFDFEVEKIAAFSEDPEHPLFKIAERDLIDSAFENLSDFRERRAWALQVSESQYAELLTEKQALYAQQEIDSISVDNGVLLRQSYLDSEHKYKARQLQEKVAQASNPDAAAELIYAFDAENDLIGYYGQGSLPDPMETVLGGLKKVASADVEYGGSSFTSSEFGDLVGRSMEKISSLFGDSFVSELKSSPTAFFNALPSPHKKALWEIINGENP